MKQSKKKIDLSSQVRVTDKQFAWGVATSECSRCGKEILERKIAAYPDDRSYWYQFHMSCIKPTTQIDSQQQYP